MFGDLFWFTGNKTTPAPAPAQQVPPQNQNRNKNKNKHQNVPKPEVVPNKNNTGGIRMNNLIGRFRDVLQTLNEEHLSIMEEMENVTSERSAKQVLRRMYHYLDQLVNVLHENPKIVREKIKEMLKQMEENEILREHRQLLLGRKSNRNQNRNRNNQKLLMNEPANMNELANQTSINENSPNNEEKEEEVLQGEQGEDGGEGEDGRVSNYPYRTSDYIESQLQTKGQQLNTQQANRDLNQLIQSRFNRV